LLSFRLTSSAVEQLASRIHAALALSGDQRAELSARLVQTAEERFSWARVASELLDAARGRSESLRRP
jgi:glycosyltransferase involved in cell wall biosynthesis